MPGFLVRRIHALWQRKGIISTVLLPVSWLVRRVIANKKKHAAQNRPKASQSRLPIVVVGNLYIGGTGKTPVVIAVAQALQARGWHPGVISRGYGATIGKHAKAGQGKLDPREFGDEPALIAQLTQAPVAVHPQRVLALQALETTYPTINVIVSDDGLQHLALERDIEIVVQDERGIGNGRVLPAGPLREPAEKLATIDYLITTLNADQASPQPLPIKARQISARMAPTSVTHLESQTTLNWAHWRVQHSQNSVSAVAAIGQPERFFSMLRACGIKLSDAIALPDHHPFAKSPFKALTSQVILITGKDAVKCGRFNDDRLWVVNAAPQFSDIAWLGELNRRLHTLAKKKSEPELN